MINTLSINRLFSDGVVLQRQKPVKIWGLYEGEAKVEVSFMGQVVNAEIEAGAWHAELLPMEAARNQVLTICAGNEKVEVSRVHVGEVWLAGGQSNMEFFMRYDADYSDTVLVCENDDIRFFDEPEACYAEQEDDFDYSRMGFWRTCDKENLEYFSAVAYYFAARVWKELGVPVGILGCNKGGSTTQSWMSREWLQKHGQVWLDAETEELALVDFRAYQEKMRHDPSMNWGNPFADVNGERLLYGMSAEEQNELMIEMQKLPVPPIHYDNRPACFYDHMLKKVAGTTIRGVIWYQGESDAFHVECYAGIFSDMIDCWRELWGEKLPFYCVQLAPFQNWTSCYGIDFPELRQIQQEVTDQKEVAYLVSTGDVGMRYDIHPKKKQPVGTRLALSALKHEYGCAVQADAPVATEVRAVGNDLHILFRGDMDTLYVEGDRIRAMQLFGEELRGVREVSFDASDFAIEGTTLILKNANMGGHRVSRVAFAQMDYYEVNIFGSHGIPAMPFCLDC